MLIASLYQFFKVGIGRSVLQMKKLRLRAKVLESTMTGPLRMGPLPLAGCVKTGKFQICMMGAIILATSKDHLRILRQRVVESIQPSVNTINILQLLVRLFSELLAQF